MTVRVLVVDDSAFFRRRVTEMLESDPRLKVIGAAANGAEGVERTLALKPDVVTMDIEMPLLDGISAVRRIMAVRPTPVLMFSSLTTEGAQATLNALEAGALDFLPKRFEDIAQDRDTAKRLLCERVHTLGGQGLRHARSAAAPSGAPAHGPAARAIKCNGSAHYKLVAIGTSTGGPVALQKILTALPANFPLPLLLVQHMPANFTAAFAERLNQLCAITVREAKDGDVLTPGAALLAPGGCQMMIEGRNGAAAVCITKGLGNEIYKPCIDTTFTSLAQACPGPVLALILTGMGADGREGARRLKQGGASIWAQDEASCVVYGMPMAVVEAGLADQVVPLGQIGACLAEAV
ncbi:MAG: chemotaxis response regulator protein-glutamate methylesterase [Gammaproteobacteria bacterium]